MWYCKVFIPNIDHIRQVEDYGVQLTDEIQRDYNIIPIRGILQYIAAWVDKTPSMKQKDKNKKQNKNTANYLQFSRS